MKLPATVFVNSKLLLQGEFILATVAPYYLARVFKFESPDEMERFVIKYNILSECEAVPGYTILICFTGNIDQTNNLPVLGHNVPKDAKQFLKQATEFYYEERIKGNETRQKKFVRH